MMEYGLPYFSYNMVTNLRCTGAYTEPTVDLATE